VARGLGRHRTIGELESAWAEAAGPRDAARTRVLSWRHGVLTVLVGHPALHEELAAFRKAELLAGLRGRLPHVRLLDLRFRVGDVGGASPDVAP
jgi:hypothetical protein